MASLSPVSLFGGGVIFLKLEVGQKGRAIGVISSVFTESHRQRLLLRKSW